MYKFSGSGKGFDDVGLLRVLHNFTTSTASHRKKGTQKKKIHVKHVTFDFRPKFVGPFNRIFTVESNQLKIMKITCANVSTIQ